MSSWVQALSPPLLVLPNPGPETSLTTGAPGPGGSGTCLEPKCAHIGAFLSVGIVSLVGGGGGGTLVPLPSPSLSRLSCPGPSLSSLPLQMAS